MPSSNDPIVITIKLKAKDSFLLAPILLTSSSRDSAVSISTGYGLDGRGVEVRVQVRSRIVSSSCRPDRLWDPPNLLLNEYQGLFPQG
jgi:hypothetical protein